MGKSSKATRVAGLGDRLTVGSLNSKMKELSLSPEKLADMVPISNMTIRRLLEKPAKTPIPAKHLVHLEPVLTMAEVANPWLSKLGGLTDVVDQLEVDGAKITNTKKVETDLKAKLKEVSSDIKTLATDLWAHATTKKDANSVTIRCIAIGALLYLINPFDLIPDSIPVVGYLDDFAIMTLALSQIRRLTIQDKT